MKRKPWVESHKCSLAKCKGNAAHKDFPPNPCKSDKFVCPSCPLYTPFRKYYIKILSLLWIKAQCVTNGLQLMQVVLGNIRNSIWAHR